MEDISVSDDEFIEVFEFDETLTPNESWLLQEGYDLDGHHADSVEEDNEDEFKYMTELLALLALDNDDDEDADNCNKF